MNTDTPTTQNLVQKLITAKKMIGAVGKDEFNRVQGFNFRGIDAVINAIDPALNELEIMTLPVRVISEERATGTSKAGGTLNMVTVTVEYMFTDGVEQLTFIGKGEAFDSGDKATAKAMSVAYRVGLIQALRLPTTDPDPDRDTYEALPDQPAKPPLPVKAQEDKQYLYDAAGRGIPVDEIMAELISPKAQADDLTPDQLHRLRIAVNAREQAAARRE